MKSISSARRCQGARRGVFDSATIAMSSESDSWTKTNEFDAWFAKRLAKKAGEFLANLKIQIAGEILMNSEILIARSAEARRFARSVVLRWMPIFAAIAMAAGLMGVSVRRARAAQDSVQEIQVGAKKFEFTPSEIHVKQGAQVRLEVTPTDREHGFELEVYPEGSDKKGDPGLKFSGDKPSFKIPQGQTQAVEFTAVEAGTYDFKCIVYCGSGHHGMKGTIVVEP
jgi:cytochrome c oxidase subunit 2